MWLLFQNTGNEYNILISYLVDMYFLLSLLICGLEGGKELQLYSFFNFASLL